VDSGVVDEIRSYKNLKDRLIIEGYKSHEDVILDYSKSDVLLLLVNNTDNAKANIPGKLFEYMATGKAVLLVSDKDTDAAKILEDKDLCYRMDYDIDKASSIEVLESFLLAADNRDEQEDDVKSLYERKNLTSKLVNLLLEL
jgi:glycosyltransferase involved in cell wall biosynthesis